MPTNSLVKTSCFSVVLAFMTLLAQAQPVANFNATPLSGCAPLVVHFSDQSTGSPTQWKWDLGNGIISFLQNPSVTYFNPGQYTIKLIVQNASGVDSIIRTNYITIYAQPQVNYLGTPIAGCFPLPVQFLDLSTPGAGNITNWQWDFGDGNSSTTQSPAHTYTASGNYNVSLRVTNSNGCFKTLTRTNYVAISNGVNADFTNTTPSSCSPPVNITFQNQSTGTGFLSYSWDFGDGGTSTLANPSHSYTNPGSYTVRLIVTNTTGCTDTIIRTNAITIGSVSASFNADNEVCVNEAFPITNTSAPAPVSAMWYFGDGTTSDQLNPVKFYTTPGTYTIKLVSNFGACTDSTTRSITVRPKPTSSFTATPVSACQTPLTVTFTNTSVNAVSSLWDFGDGTTSTNTNPVHTYTTPGSFNVTLITTNSFGCTDTLVQPGFIDLSLPSATINNLPQRGCAPLGVQFNATVVSNEPIVSYLWNFGDGNTSTEITPGHVYQAGTYDVTLIVTTASGCADTVVVGEGVKAGIKPVANFNANPTDVCARSAVNFFDQSTGTPDQWHWDFGDGGTSNMENPIHVYEDTGYFDVQLVVWNNGCSDTIKFLNYIHINPPIAVFAVNLDCGDPTKRTFTDQSIGADKWAWDFGDGNTSTAQNPVHNYAAPGTYTVKLTVTNTASGCYFIREQETVVMMGVTDFSATDTVICRNTQTTFNAISAPGIVSYKWLFGDGDSSIVVPATHVYTNAGYYTVKLITANFYGCYDTITKINYIRVNGPTANFGVVPSGVCSMSTVPLNDSSLTDGTHAITTWEWNYGDGIIEILTTAPFTHAYNAPGSYTISLKVTDTEGCIDSIVRPAVLTISQPTAEFATADTITCPGRNVTFTNLSAGPSLSYNWNFGDGGTSTSANPVHSYTADGSYTVRLIITDQFGCIDTIIKPDYIQVATPQALFAVSDTVGTCPPLIVNFTNNSLNYASLNWDFGDGTSSQSPNPSHFYSTPGIYNASLTVTALSGCVSVKPQTIVVRGPQGSFVYGGLSGCDSLTVNFVATTQDRLSFIWDFADGTTINTTDSVISHTYTTHGDFVPKMILLDAGGCVVPIIGPDTIRIKGAAAAFTTSTTLVCNEASVQFTNNTVSNDGILSYHWNFGDGTTSTDANPTHFYNTTGLYYPTLTVNTLSGCNSSVTHTAPVKVVKAPEAAITQTANGCAPVTVSFNGSLLTTDTSTVAWNWSFGNGNVSTQQTPAPQLYATSGIFNVRLLATNSSGCVDTVLTTVNAFVVPTVSAGVDTMVCRGRSVNLTASGADSYTWSGNPGLSCYNCPNPSASPDSMRMYYVTGITTQGCMSTDSILVNVKQPFNMLSSAPDTLCAGSSVKLQASGGYTYSWSPSTGLNNTTIANPTANPSTTTTYTVIATDDRNCFTDTAFVPIAVYPIPTVNAGSDVTINVGQMTDLMPTISSDVTEVVWSPTGSIFRTQYPGITVKPRETTTYKVDVINRGGCKATDNLTVNVLCNGANVFIPNTFSPNSDGTNDVFYPRGTGLFSIKTARIYNRWGEIVYERSNFQANDIQAGWDGTFKGVKLNPDVYVYVIEILCDNNTALPFKGNVALVR